MPDVTITLSDNGPYIIRGEIEMVDEEGKKVRDERYHRPLPLRRFL